MSFVYHKIFTQIDQTVDTIPPALSSTFLAIITKKYQLVFKAHHQRGVVHRAGDSPLFSQSKAKDWWYLSELIPDQHAHWIEGVNMWAALNPEWQLGGWGVGGGGWQELTAQRCATGTSPVCFSVTSCQLEPLWTPLQPHVPWFHWKCLSYKPVSDSAHWNQHVPGCTALGENGWMHQWFNAGIILCMITDNDVSENGHHGYGMSC